MKNLININSTITEELVAKALSINLDNKSIKEDLNETLKLNLTDAQLESIIKYIKYGVLVYFI